MGKIFTVFMWEIRKLFSSWRRTFTLFLLPAIFLVGMLNLFPILINYMTTGTLNKQPVMVVNAPESFIEYIDDNVKAKILTVRSDLIMKSLQTRIQKQKVKQLFVSFLMPTQ